MEILRSCKIIYEDLTIRQIGECDGIMSIFTTPNISGLDFLIVLTCILTTIYFILKTIILFKKD